MFLVVPWIAALISFFFGWATSLTFICGTLLSLLAGDIGMNVAVRANVRAANAARKSSAATFRVSFLGGAVTGLLGTGIALLGLFFLRLIFSDLQTLVGFGFGASLAALFAQIGGGIFTKSADIGADLAGKLEEGIPEDDPNIYSQRAEIDKPFHIIVYWSSDDSSHGRDRLIHTSHVHDERYNAVLG